MKKHSNDRCEHEKHQVLTYTILKDINLFISYDITLDLQTYAHLNKCLLVKHFRETST